MRKLVVLSLDAMFDQDLSLFNENSWLKTWLSQASVCTQVKTIFPALTYPAHTTLVTGCDPAQHGIGHNQPFQPGKEPNMRLWHWEHDDIQRETLQQAVHRQGGRVASMLWPITGKTKAIRWNFPEVLALPGENQVLKMLQYGSAPWIILMELLHGRKRKSIHEPHLSDYAVTLACDVIRRHQPELTLVHMVDLDEARHRHGVYSDDALQALRRMEERVRKVWECMQQTPGMEDALLVLLSDHGQADVSKTVHIGDLLKANGLADCVRVQSCGMSAYLYEGDHGAEGLRSAEAWLRQQGANHGISHVYTREELDAIGCAAGPAFALEAAEQVVFADGLPQAKREKATHGFGPGHRAENCLMAIRGKGIKEGCVLPPMPMRDVAPTLAELMGVSLPDAVGNSVAINVKSGANG